MGRVVPALEPRLLLSALRRSATWVLPLLSWAWPLPEESSTVDVRSVRNAPGVATSRDAREPPHPVAARPARLSATASRRRWEKQRMWFMTKTSTSCRSKPRASPRKNVCVTGILE